MSYQVLARKWRPRIFSELVGQAHVVRALSNALDNDRLHHAYLFTGTRGVGKTTLARIFAKSLNCEHGVGSTPCGQCSICREIDEGRFVDLLEVDAASRTKVDQTRELLENVPYAPVRGRYKVYLIDEVHMFSDSSFNALLKTLEEPPPHVKFLLATTDPQKVPVTVLSRCLQFNLKRLPLDQIQDYLQELLNREGIQHEVRALTLLAKGADGSMRDALSLMDQAIAFGAGKVIESDVQAMLGTLAHDRVHELLDALAEMDAQRVVTLVSDLAEMAPDFAGVLQDLLSLLHRIALVQAVPDAVDNSLGDQEQVIALAGKLLPEDVQLFYQIGLIGQRDLSLAPDPRAGFEMVLLRMLAFRPQSVDEASGASHQAAPSTPVKKKQSESVAVAPVKPETRPVATTTAHPTTVADQPKPALKRPIDAPASPGEPVEFRHWHQVVDALTLGGIAKQLANNCVYDYWDGVTLSLKLDQAHQHMHVGSTEQRLLQALETYIGRELKLKIVPDSVQVATPAKLQAQATADRQKAAEDAIQEDPMVLALKAQLGASIIPGSVRPIDE
ncbi:DNA polymerase III subunit gamma/tau [Sedimenticola selenatireducens]|uniref:DNA polymerase III subunit gamma/tau n=1 Tax=Sedimenticola selenatireducens TaxID=191960 RepID=A0A558DL17_9GAMM|nr:DNA polymerase III subunit gamma/tau [Sedimenticola selenatireducens]TVO70074.1 DNA polymerase III subunit gamma/tau [Sedimenticola selenatireducens]TVT61684.1 MAG: DNA polymerase III subunit gamma/tau [Sedimenticola selenatireducens]